MNKPLTASLIAATAVALAACAGFGVFAPGGIQRTDDAYISADFTPVAPKVAGFIEQLLVQDNQPVEAGQLLAVLDARDYQAALAQAQAQQVIAQARSADARATLLRQGAVIEQAQASVNAEQATLAFREHELVRYQRLASDGAGTLQNAQQAQSRAAAARANLSRAQAALQAARQQVAILQAQVDSANGEQQRADAQRQQAELNLSYTRITAPVAGVIGQRAARVGAYVTPGTRLLAVVPLASAYVLANFQEDQLAAVTPGQAVEIAVDSFAGQSLHGHVDSLAPATGVTFAAVRPDNATGNFTKVVQRVPVKIVLDPGQPLAERLRVGLSVVARIDTRSVAQNTVSSR